MGLLNVKLGPIIINLSKRSTITSFGRSCQCLLHVLKVRTYNLELVNWCVCMFAIRYLFLSYDGVFS